MMNRDNQDFHAVDKDTELACTWLEDFINEGNGQHGTPEGIQKLFSAFDALMARDWRDFPR